MAAEFRARQFRAADMESVLRIERASFGRDAYDRNLFAEYARARAGVFLVAESERRVAAYSIAWRPGGRREIANLISIAADPGARRRGAASLLLKSTIRRLKLRGVKRLTLTVRQSNAAARRFYERHGFRAVRRAPGYYEDGEDGVLMRREL